MVNDEKGWLVCEVWKTGQVQEFGPFSTKVVAEDFAANAQMPNALEVLERIDIVEV